MPKPRRQGVSCSSHLVASYMLTPHVHWRPQVPKSPAGSHSTTQSASASSPSPAPSQGLHRAASGSNQPGRPGPTAADALTPTQGKPASGGREKITAASSARPDVEQPSVGRVPKSPGRGSSRVPASPGRRTWACSACGISARMLEGGKLRECSACGSVRYCGRACQKADWPAHKTACKRIQTARG
jgi:hypothetical protein